MDSAKNTAFIGILAGLVFDDKKLKRRHPDA
jgi:hypothetical protein